MFDKAFEKFYKILKLLFCFLGIWLLFRVIFIIFGLGFLQIKSTEVLFSVSDIIAFFFIFCIIGFIIYEFLYYKSVGFLEIKKQIENHVHKYNELDSYLKDVKQIENKIFGIHTTNGSGNVGGNGKYKFIREFERYGANIYNCSLNILNSAKNKPFEYVCKYFSISKSKESIYLFEELLCAYYTLEQGIDLLEAEKQNIIESISKKIPLVIKTFSKKLESNLGFNDITFKKDDYAYFRFLYVSAGERSVQNFDVPLSPEDIRNFIGFLEDKIKSKNSIQYQRNLMTKELREQIKKRDNFTCKMCNNSTYLEPNLLLEIDHIIPLSKGGLSKEDNLQTLCWRCNRKKSNKIIN